LSINEEQKEETIGLSINEEQKEETIGLSINEEEELKKRRRRKR
jgi:hypothetical protein